MINNASGDASWLWGNEDLLGELEGAMFQDDWEILDYEQPFRKFHLKIRGAEMFHRCMEEIAHELANNSTTDAFRIAARVKVFNAPCSRDCLW
jgi:hypothetical protein